MLLKLPLIYDNRSQPLPMNHKLNFMCSGTGRPCSTLQGRRAAIRCSCTKHCAAYGEILQSQTVVFSVWHYCHFFLYLHKAQFMSGAIMNSNCSSYSTKRRLTTDVPHKLHLWNSLAAFTNFECYNWLAH